MVASTHSGMLLSETSSMSRLAFSSCAHRMNQTEVMVNQPKTCGTMRLVCESVSVSVAGVGLGASRCELFALLVRTGTSWRFSARERASTPATRSCRPWAPP